ncbi:MAG: CvpA family protein [Clostridia bacterium]|nr:CvpA family protein [Clostridia bacterium]
MKIVIDIFLILVFAGAIYQGWSNGFVKSIMEFARWGVSLLATIILGPLLAVWTGIHVLITLILVFAVSFGIMTLIFLAVKKLAELPVLRTMDKFLGVVAGVFNGVVRVIFLATILSVILIVLDYGALTAESFVLRIFSGLIDIVFR